MNNTEMHNSYWTPTTEPFLRDHEFERLHEQTQKGKNKDR